jgi:hypothetical protein
VKRHSGTYFFPYIGITNTTPLLPNFGPLFAFRNLFRKKNSPAYNHRVIYLSKLRIRAVCINLHTVWYPLSEILGFERVSDFGMPVLYTPL